MHNERLVTAGGSHPAAGEKRGSSGRAQAARAPVTFLPRIVSQFRLIAPFSSEHTHAPAPKRFVFGVPSGQRKNQEVADANAQH